MSHEVSPDRTAAAASGPDLIPCPEAPAGTAVRAALADGVRRLLVAEPDAGQGDVEGVHQMRVATRRLRSDLRTFRPLIDPDWAGPLREELRWLGRALGDVRELDVLTDRLRRSAGQDVGALGPIFGRLAQRHAAALAELDAALVSARFAELKGRLIEASQRPALTGDHQVACRDALPPLVASAWRRLARRGRALRDRDPEEEFHEVRIRAKRARYAAEAVAPALDPGVAAAALKFARAAQKIPDVLGEHQDATVARATVEQLAAEVGSSGEELPPNFRAATARLARTQAEAARKARRRFAKAWKKLDRRKRLAWLGV